MEQVVTYQAIIAYLVEKGPTDDDLRFIRKLLLHVGRLFFGEPSQDILAILNTETSVPRLCELSDGVYHASSWDELFPTPAIRLSSHRRKRRDS